MRVCGVALASHIFFTYSQPSNQNYSTRRKFLSESDIESDFHCDEDKPAY